MMMCKGSTCLIAGLMNGIQHSPFRLEIITNRFPVEKFPRACIQMQVTRPVDRTTHVKTNNMKNTLLTIAAGVILCGLYSCETDNYVAPGATIQGQIVDPQGVRVQLEQGSSTRIRLEELSWSDNPIPIYLNVKQDGSY